MANDMRKIVGQFIKQTEALFEGTGVEFWEHDKKTDQVFLIVGDLFTDQHRLAIQGYLKEFNKHILVGIIHDGYRKD